VLPWPEKEGNPQRTHGIVRPLVTGSKLLRVIKSKTLATLRDALLPKLMSGEIRTRDAGETDVAI